ncbi:MAG TPA: hypothetical protein PL110_15635 [Candidatus Eremiobacteraeota bacterium]|nr:hypothetical protein [Candidatus Eremiobacteraeota bacterium]
MELADYSAPNNAISFLSAYDAFTGRTAYDKAGLMAWKKYIIFYVEDDKRVTPTGYYQLFSREVSLGEFADPNGKGYGTKCISEMPYFPLESEVEKTDNRHTTIHYIGLTSDIYTSSPRPIARNITLLNFELDFINRRVVINLQTGKPINPNDINSEASPEKSKFRAVVTLRNN